MRGRAGKGWRVEGKADPQAGSPLVHVHKQKSALRIAAMNERAQALGLRIGQGLADAKAAHPDLDIVPADPDADRRLLEAVADWCDRYTPLVAIDRAGDGLYLDITGCAHLFGGEHALLRDLVRRLLDQGFDARGAVAATPGAAHAAARFGDALKPLHLPSGAEADVLRPFPLSALRIDDGTCAGLEQVGLKTVAHLMDVPRAPLVRRFGRACLMRLDQALGNLDEVLQPRLPVPDLSAERRLAEPVGLIEDIEQLLYGLAQTLKADLEVRGVGGRAFEYTLFRADGVVQRLCVGASRAVRDPERITKLFRERLAGLGDDFDAGYGFDLVRLNVLAHERMADTQGDFGSGSDTMDDVAALLDRIAARLGGQVVRHPEAVESHEPQHAERWITGKSAKSQDGKTVFAPMAARPLRLLERSEPLDVLAEVPEGPPLRFQWRRVSCKVVKAEGPERIAGEWWGDEAPENLAPVPRDYYRVEDEAGRRYWLYREGLYGPRGDADAKPRWFMQGLFA